MTDNKSSLEKRLRELEIELEEVKSMSLTRNTLLEAHIKELNDVYNVLREKLDELRRRDERIKSFEGELEKANKLSSLGELAGSIAHEIKNPLISIQGFAKRIDKTQDIEKIEKYGRLIDKEAGRLSNLLVKLLEFSRMDTPRREYVDPNDIVDDTILFTEHHLTRFKNVRLLLEKEKDLPRIHVDKVHIEQVIVNIINNAAQAMPDGGVVRIKTGKENDNIFISISDTGVGIREENLSRIFEPFYTTKQVSEGTGLGLSLSKRLMEANNGKIEVRSVVGQGTTFKLLVPYGGAA